MGRIRTRISIWFFLSAALVFLGVSPGLSNQIVLTSDDQFDFASGMMNRGDYRQATWEFERFLHFFPEDPKVPKARYLVGMCQFRDRRYEAARETFSRILSSEPHGPLAAKALFMTGETFYEQGLLAEAGSCFEQLVESYPHLEVRNAGLYRLGWTRMREARWREASQIFGLVEEESALHAGSLALEQESLKGETMPYKSPARAGVLAGVLPGLGHAYVSRYKDATVAFLLNGVFIWAAMEAFHEDLDVLGGILTFLEIGWYTGNIYSAVNVTHKHNRKLRTDFLNGLEDRLDLHFLTAKKKGVGLALSLRF